MVEVKKGRKAVKGRRARNGRREWKGKEVKGRGREGEEGQGQGAGKKRRVEWTKGRWPWKGIRAGKRRKVGKKDKGIREW